MNTRLESQKSAVLAVRHFLAGALLLASTNANAIDWTVTELASPANSLGDINNVGQMVVNGQLGKAVASSLNPYIYDNGQVRDLGTLNGNRITAWSINDVGQVVGWAEIDGASRAVVYRNGKWTDLGLGPYSLATDINNAGQIVGTYGALGSQHAFLYQNGTVSDLGTLGGTFSEGRAINNLGQVVGKSATTAGDLHGFLYQDGKMTDLGTLSGGTVSEPFDINVAGEIVGEADLWNGTGHAFLHENGAMTDLTADRGRDLVRPPLFMNVAVAINSVGAIVAYEERSTIEWFLYTDDEITNLTELPGDWKVESVMSINDRGQIFAVAEHPTKGEHILLLTPVPETSQCLMLLVGLSVLVVCGGSRFRSS